MMLVVKGNGTKYYKIVAKSKKKKKKDSDHTRLDQ